MNLIRPDRLAVTFVVFLCFASMVSADVPEVVRFQGTVALLQGQPPADGDYAFLVEIFDQATGGAPLYSQTATAPMANGAYTVTVSPSTPGDLRTALGGAGARFLQVTVLTDPLGGTVNEVLMPRQQIASVPYAISSGAVPSGGIILWDQSQQCPEGYSEATEFRGLLARGADVAGASAGIPQEAGKSCAGTPDPECSATAGAYDDALEVSELAPHDHHGWGESNSTWPLGAVGPNNKMGSSGGFDFDNYHYKTTSTGDGGAHFHPFRTVLFCRRD